MACTLDMITPVRCEQYDAISRGDVLARRTAKGNGTPAGMLLDRDSNQRVLRWNSPHHYPSDMLRD
jgi:hypothetical protein